MISIENADERSGLEQRFRSNRRDMGEFELEEGEACSYLEENDSSIEPDVALSYLDEKLQNVLGHFKKDFEGVVSAENLGAKYGMYGSFLPAHRRSPVLSHSRSPPRVQNHNGHSLSTSKVEGVHYNSSVQASVPHSTKHGSISVGSASLSKLPSQSNQHLQTSKTQSVQSVGDCTPKSEVRDQRTFKVRIKVGSDNLSVKKNTDIYSDLGLGYEGSPSSSFDNSPVECEKLSGTLPSDPHESPTHILIMMTSSPLLGGYLLSPLPDQLLELSEMPRFMHDNKPSSVHSDMKLLDKKGSSLQVKKERENIGFDVLVKETDVDALSYEELVSSALKLPLLCNAEITSKDNKKVASNENLYSDVLKRETLEPLPNPVSASGKADIKLHSAGNHKDTISVEASKKILTDSGKNGENKGETASSSTNTDSGRSKSKRGSKSGRKDPVKLKGEKSSTSEGGLGLSRQKEQFSGDRKLRKNEVSGSAPRQVAAESLNDIELEKSQKPKSLSKVIDNNYKEFFGDLNDEADIMDSPHSPSDDRLKTADVGEMAALTNGKFSRDRSSSVVTVKEEIPGAGFIAPFHNNSLPANELHISEPAHGGVDTDDKWVCCDKCLQWRLLPPGSKVDSLPEKWLCSMMTWLPDMNRCSFSEEETNKAFRARYHLVSENLNGLHNHVDGVANGMHSADALGTIIPSDVNMIDKVRKHSKSSFQDSPHRNSSYIKKKQLSAKDRSSAEAKLPPVNGSSFQQLPKSTDTHLDTNHKRAHKYRGDHEANGGHAKMSKIRSKREPNQEYPRTSKKTKTQSISSGDNNQQTMHDPDSEKLGVNSGYGTVGKSRFQVEELPDKFGVNNIAPKKRKADKCQDLQSSTLVRSTPKSEQSSRKKHKSGGKESRASKRDGKEDKRVKSVPRHGLDDTESLRKGSSSAPLIVPTTSSSSKVSDSLKDKSKFQELKGSPVDSISSSPFRSSNANKITLGRKIDRDNIQDAHKVAVSSPRKFSNIEYECSGDYFGSKRNDVIKSGALNGPVDPSMIDQKDKSNRHLHHKNGMVEISPSKFNNGLSINNLNNSVEADDGSNLSRQGKSWKDSPSLYQDKKDKSNSQKGIVKSESYDNQTNNAPVYEDKEKIKVQEKLGSNAVKTEKDVSFNNQDFLVPKSKIQQENDDKRSSKKFDMGKPEHLSTSATEKSRHLLPADMVKNGGSSSSSDAHGGDFSKEPQRNRKSDGQNGSQSTPSKHPIPNGQKVNNLDAPSPLRRDASSSQAASNALKEAKNLKHLADRLKNAGSAESTGMYFEAALKFLHGASLLESGKFESSKHGDVGQSMEIYRSTAKLCQFCAHEYEKSKDMATAALAYKCMEVAFLRVIYSIHHSASRDHHELQTVLQMVPPGESPSSSASDIDNLNHSVTGDKAAQAKIVGSPQVATNLVIAARNRPNFSRLLNFAQDVNFAMEASRKSRAAFAAANAGIDQGGPKNVIASIKTALDFNFHDVEGLLLLVRLAKEATSH